MVCCEVGEISYNVLVMLFFIRAHNGENVSSEMSL
jgi:hypothetical protein